MEKKTIIGIVCVVVVYVLSVLGASLLGFLSAYFWVGSPILASLLCAFSYAWLARRWRKSGLATVLSLAVVFFFLGVLPVIYPPSALVIHPILTILGCYLGWTASKNSCNKSDD